MEAPATLQVSVRLKPILSGIKMKSIQNLLSVLIMHNSIVQFRRKMGSDPGEDAAAKLHANCYNHCKRRKKSNAVLNTQKIYWHHFLYPLVFTVRISIKTVHWFHLPICDILPLIHSMVET